jgi:galactokinase
LFSETALFYLFGNYAFIMGNTIRDLTISTPGRVCLFGEHQDYLFLPVIPCAISMRVWIEGTRCNDAVIHLDLPDISSSETFPIDGIQPYNLERDYYKSVFNVLAKKGFAFDGGFNCRVRGEIPINAGTSSSSALVISWVNFLATMSRQGRTLTPLELARYGYEAEVLEFNEPGGMMDQYSTAFGGIISIDFQPEVKVEKIDAELETFVLGDSGEPKDTKYILARVKNRVLGIISKLAAKYSEFNLLDATPQTVEALRAEMSDSEYELLRGTLRNRDITFEAQEVLRHKPLNHRRIGELLNEHQTILREVLKISTPKIDSMLDAAIKAGAYGGKINGSGGGGCMFAYAPEHPEKIAAAIRDAGGKAYIISADTGSRVDHKEG